MSAPITPGWRERSYQLGHARTLLIKVGSAVISGKNGLDQEVMASLAGQMAALLASTSEQNGRKIILVSSGAVAAGRGLLRGLGKNTEKNGLAQKQAAAAIGQGMLMAAWGKAFKPYGVPVAQILLTRDDLRSRERFLNARNTFFELLSLGVLPIVNENDTVSVSELKFGDNDCLASLLVNLAQADVFINLTSAPGVKADNPQLNPDAPILQCIPDMAAIDPKKICGEKTASGSGGMYSKLVAARRAAQLGVGTLVLPGREQNSLAASFTNLAASQPGTWICPDEHAVSRRKFWLAYQSSPQGALEIDQGAAEALLSHGASLLPGGIVNVAGTFAKGALLAVTCGGREIGAGLSNYNSATLQKIRGLKRHEVAAILGQAHYPEVIHRDNLLLDAAF